MIYNKLDGTTSKSFKLGKNGITFESLSDGTLKIYTESYEFILGNDEVEGLYENGAERKIASWQVVQSYIAEQLESVTGDVSGELEDLLEQINGIAAALDNDPDFYLHVLRLQDTDGNAVDGQVVKGTTTFEKDITLGGKIIGPATLTIDPYVEDTINPENPNLGTVVIHGNLQVDGTTTTINSQTVDIFDKNITLAVDSPNAEAADGAGITIDLGEDDGEATLTYGSSDDNFVFNKDVKVPNLLSTGEVKGTELISTVATGTAPLTVTSTTKVDNLNVDRVDGLHFRVDSETGVLERSDDGTEWTPVSQTAQSILDSLKTVDGAGSGLDADLLDGANLETTLSPDSNTTIPTSKAVADYAVPQVTSAILPFNFGNSAETATKENKFVFVYDEETETSGKVSLAALQRPSVYAVEDDSEVPTKQEIRVGDFIYAELE